MKFKRCEFRLSKDFKINNRKLSAKKKAIEKNNDKYSLFEEFQEKRDPAELLKDDFDNWNTWKKSWREDQFLKWRLIRANFRDLYSEFIKKLPSVCYNPTYFFDFLRNNHPDRLRSVANDN